MLSGLTTLAGGITTTPGGCDAIVDATALDTGHRGRGIGRYVAGLVGGLAELAAAGEADLSMAALRLPDAETAVGADAAVAGSLDAGAGLDTWTLRRPRTTHPLRWMMNEALLPGEVRRSGAGIYHATEPWAVPVGEGFRTVVTVHDVIPLLYPEHYMNREHLQWRAYFAWMLRRERWARCDRIIAISEATKATVVEHLGVPEERITVVYNGIDHEHFGAPVGAEQAAEVRARLGLEAPYLLYVGGYDWRKNIHTLVSAMAELAGSGVELVLAGGMDAATRAELDERGRAAGVAKQIRYLGYVDDRDLPTLYAEAELFAYPSLAEGFGLQILEAMARGCPVVTSDRSSLAEVAADAALCVDPTEPTQLGWAMRRIVEDDDLRDTLVERGRRRAAEFSWRRCARETAAVYGALAVG